MITKGYSLIRYVSDGETKEYVFDFDIIENFGDSQIVVFVKKYGAVETLTQGIDYVLQLTDKKISLFDVLPEGENLIIARNLPYNQTYNFENLGLNRSSQIEKAVDYRALCEQQIKDGVPALLAGFDYYKVNSDLSSGQIELNQKIEEIDERKVEKSAIKSVVVGVEINADEVSGRLVTTRKNAYTGEEYQESKTILEDLFQKVNIGSVIIGSFDFLTGEPSEEELTNRAQILKGDNVATGDIIVNLYDKKRWYWNGTKNKWIDIGRESFVWKYPEGTDPRSVRNEGFFYIENAAKDNTLLVSYDLPTGVRAQNRCFGYCLAGKDSDGLLFYRILANFLNSGVGGYKEVNGGGFVSCASDASIVLNNDWESVAKETDYKDYAVKNVFVEINGNNVDAEVPLPTASKTKNGNGKYELRFDDLVGVHKVLCKGEDGYYSGIIKNSGNTDLVFEFGEENLETGDIYAVGMINEDFLYGFGNLVKPFNRIINARFQDVADIDVPRYEGGLVYSNIEDAFAIVKNNSFMYVAAVYLGNYKIKDSGDAFEITAIKRGAVGFRLLPNIADRDLSNLTAKGERRFEKVIELERDTNLNSLLDPGFYRVYVSQIGLNQPLDATRVWYVFVSNDNAAKSQVIQIAFSDNAIGIYKRNTTERVDSPTGYAWTSWQKMEK